MQVIPGKASDCEALVKAIQATRGGSDNMRDIVTNEYDDGNGGGNSLLTKTSRRVDEVKPNNRITRFEHDWRNCWC